MNSHILNLYLNKIGFKGNATPSLNTVQKITQLHTQTFPFENINGFLGIPVRLDLDSIVRKFLYDNRSGYCFEHHNLMMEVLREIGIPSRGLLGKVYQRDNDITTMLRTHMILLLEFDGTPYLLDVGFGGAVPTIPLKFELNTVQETPRESYRIVKERMHYVLQIAKGNRFIPLYLFDLQETYQPDYEIANWYTSTNPNVQFTNDLIVSIIDHEFRYTMKNNELSIYNMDKKIKRQVFSDASEIREVLHTKFKLDLHNLPGLDQKLNAKINAKPIGDFSEKGIHKMTDVTRKSVLS